MSHFLTIDDQTLPVVIRQRRGSRRMVIRYQPLSHSLSLTLPRQVTIRQGLRFAEDKRDWIARQLRERPPARPFSDGEIISVLGQRYRLRHVGGRGVVHIKPPPPNPLPQGEGEIIIPGAPEFLARRVREWVTGQAREAIEPLAREKAALLRKPIRRITLRDTRSLWGSCTRGGNLSFCWRLALAPRHVLDYVVCHEVSHLLHLNHSAKFWETVAALCPDYQAARQWLRAHGHTLYRYL